MALTLSQIVTSSLSVGAFDTLTSSVRCAKTPTFLKDLCVCPHSFQEEDHTATCLLPNPSQFIPSPRYALQPLPVAVQSNKKWWTLPCDSNINISTLSPRINLNSKNKNELSIIVYMQPLSIKPRDWVWTKTPFSRNCPTSTLAEILIQSRNFMDEGCVFPSQIPLIVFS
jgi:hypothetical protein